MLLGSEVELIGDQHVLPGVSHEGEVLELVHAADRRDAGDHSAVRHMQDPSDRHERPDEQREEADLGSALR